MAFSGGRGRKGETIEQALSNELLQETGLQLIGKPVLHGVFYNNGVSNRDHVLVYVCHAKGDLPHKPSNPEIAEIRYFSMNDLPDSIDHGTLRRMREIVDGTAPTEVW